MREKERKRERNTIKVGEGRVKSFDHALLHPPVNSRERRRNKERTPTARDSGREREKTFKIVVEWQDGRGTGAKDKD